MPADLRSERMQASRQFRDGRFHNSSGIAPGMPADAFPIFRDLLLRRRDRVPRITIPVDSPLSSWATPPSSGLRITWLGHSTLLIEVDGRRILTDPVFGLRASPFAFVGPRRFHATPVTISQLPALDAVLVSHDHHDHLDPSSIRELAALRVPFITSLGVGARLEQFGVDPQTITELDWWEGHPLAGGGLSFTATPSQHFSGRGLFDRNSTLWSSWVIQTDNRRLFFSGDTGLTPELGEIGKRFGPFDVSMLEIGAAHPAWEPIHLGPANALRALELLGGGPILPIHWGTFDLALHAWDEPIETLLSLAEPGGERVITPMLGRALEPNEVQTPLPWWRLGADRVDVPDAQRHVALWTPRSTHAAHHPVTG